MAAVRGCRPVVLMAVLVLTGCTSGPNTVSSQPSTSPSVTPSSAAPSSGPGRTPPGGAGPSSPAPTGSAPATQGSRRLRVTTSARIDLRGQTYGRGLVLWGDYAAWMGCSGCQRTFQEPRSLYVADIRTQRVRRVADAARGGLLVPLGGNGSVLVYGESAPGAHAATGWRLQTLDVVSGRRATLATATQPGGGYPPVAVVGAGQVVFQTFPQGSPGGFHGPVRSVDLSSGVQRTVSRGLPGVLSGVVAGGLLYKGADPPEAIDQGPTFVALTTPGRRDPRILSDTQDVREVTADEQTVAWQTADGGPDAGVWARQLTGTTPAVLVHRGGTNDRAVGTGFVAVVTAGDYPVILMYPATPGPPVAAGDVPGEFDALAADGSRLAYLALPGERGVQPDAKHPILLVVDTVEPPAAP